MSDSCIQASHGVHLSRIPGRAHVGVNQDCSRQTAAKAKLRMYEQAASALMQINLADSVRFAPGHHDHPPEPGALRSIAFASPGGAMVAACRGGDLADEYWPFVSIKDWDAKCALCVHREIKENLDTVNLSGR